MSLVMTKALHFLLRQSIRILSRHPFTSPRLIHRTVLVQRRENKITQGNSDGDSSGSATDVRASNLILVGPFIFPSPPHGFLRPHSLYHLQALIRQITASVTFLPLLVGWCCTTTSPLHMFVRSTGLR